MGRAVPDRIEPGIGRPVFAQTMLDVMQNRVHPRRIDVRIAVAIPNGVEQPGLPHRTDFVAQFAECGVFRRGLQPGAQLADRHAARQFAGPFGTFLDRGDAVDQVLEHLENRRLDRVTRRGGGASSRVSPLTRRSARCMIRRLPNHEITNVPPSAIA